MLHPRGPAAGLTCLPKGAPLPKLCLHPAPAFLAEAPPSQDMAVTPRGACRAQLCNGAQVCSALGGSKDPLLPGEGQLLGVP